VTAPEPAGPPEPTPAEVAAQAMNPTLRFLALDPKATAQRPPLSPAEAAAQTDARLAAGEHIAAAAAQDATVRRLRDLGDHTVRSPFYGDGS
jgi:hypothetical protein